MRTYLEIEDLWDVIEPAQGAAVDAKKDQIARGKIIFFLDPSTFHHAENARLPRSCGRSCARTLD